MWKEHRKFLVNFMRLTGMKKTAQRGNLQEWISETADKFVEVSISGIVLIY